MGKLLQRLLVVLLYKLRISQSVKCQRIGTSIALTGKVDIAVIVLDGLAIVSLTRVGLTAPE